MNISSPWDDEPDLPDDGFPRITLEGIQLIKDGLAGDLSGYEHSFGNHPYHIPSRFCRNIVIKSDGKGHMVAEAWYGPTQVEYHLNVTSLAFDRIDDMAVYTPPTGYVKLHANGDWWNKIAVLIGDSRVEDLNGFFDGSATTLQNSADEEFQGCTMPEPDSQRTLEAWFRHGPKPRDDMDRSFLNFLQSWGRAVALGSLILLVVSILTDDIDWFPCVVTAAAGISLSAVVDVLNRRHGRH